MEKKKTVAVLRAVVGARVVGTAWVELDGTVTVQLEAVPVDGRFRLVPFAPVALAR